MRMYDMEGNALTIESVQKAFSSGKARIVYGRSVGHTTTTLALDGIDIDTRGECYRMAEEQWTVEPETVGQCIRAAQGKHL